MSNETFLIVLGVALMLGIVNVTASWSIKDKWRFQVDPKLNIGLFVIGAILVTLGVFKT